MLQFFCTYNFEFKYVGMLATHLQHYVSMHASHLDIFKSLVTVIMVTYFFGCENLL